MQIESIEAIRNAANGKEQRVKTELQEFSDRNPEIAAQLIRSWLKGDDKHG
jgi:flagellar M-ring protein FliF